MHPATFDDWLQQNVNESFHSTFNHEKEDHKQKRRREAQNKQQHTKNKTSKQNTEEEKDERGKKNRKKKSRIVSVSNLLHARRLALTTGVELWMDCKLLFIIY